MQFPQCGGYEHFEELVLAVEGVIFEGVVDGQGAESGEEDLRGWTVDDRPLNQIPDVVEGEVLDESRLS